MRLRRFGNYRTPNGVPFVFGNPDETPSDPDRGPGDSLNCVIDVKLEGKDGTGWANFVTQDFVRWMMEKDARIGESLGELYFSMPDNMVIVREMTPEIVGKVIDHLIEKEEVDFYFKEPSVWGPADREDLHRWTEDLGDPNETVRGNAIQELEWLGQTGDTRAVPPLIDALSDSSLRVRRRVIEALGYVAESGDARAVPPLIDALNDPNRKVRRRAAEALTRVDDTRTVLPLIGSLSDPSWRGRKEASVALGRLVDVRAVPPLIEALDESRVDTGGSVGDARELGPCRGSAPINRSPWRSSLPRPRLRCCSTGEARRC